METIKPKEEIFIYKKVPLDLNRVLNITTVTGDLKSWNDLRKAFYKKHDVVNEYISSQFAIGENPNYATMIRAGIKPPPGTEQHIQTVIITSVFEFHGFVNGHTVK
jgi:hypothetical protein